MIIEVDGRRIENVTDLHFLLATKPNKDIPPRMVITWWDTRQKVARRTSAKERARIVEEIRT